MTIRLCLCVGLALALTAAITHVPEKAQELPITQTADIPDDTPEPSEADIRAVESMLRYNPKLQREEAEKLWGFIVQTVERFRADASYNGGATKEITPELVLSVILVESSARADARSKAGALGLMQVVPRHHLASLESAGIIPRQDRNELFNVEQNVMAGTYILMCYAMNSKTIEEALARYNAGRRIARGMPYARKVLRVHSRLTS